jgi:hypothetical protein
MHAPQMGYNKYTSMVQFRFKQTGVVHFLIDCRCLIELLKFYFLIMVNKKIPRKLSAFWWRKFQVE